jgi:hypothetical protein
MEEKIGLPSPRDESAWEAMWAPYDEETYQAVLDQIEPNDILLEIGAGDLRLAKRMAKISKRVYAIENQRKLIEASQETPDGYLPENVTVLIDDARSIPFPPDVTTGVLLMRHCTHFRLYADKLKVVGCQKLITNSRWRLGVEVIGLFSPRIRFKELNLGWYACWCGAIGFKIGPVEQLTAEIEGIVHEISECPQCQPTTPARVGENKIQN